MGRFIRMRYKVAFIILGLIVFLSLLVFSFREKPDKAVADLIRSAAADGKLAYKLTEPEELETLLGPPLSKFKPEGPGGLETVILQYRGINAVFTRMKNYPVPYTLKSISVGGRSIDIGRKRPILLKKEADIRKFDPFWGFEDASLVNLDLRKHGEFLHTIPFDSRTKWPEPNKMPEGFDPARLLEEGKNQGLGIRKLHEQGIDGRGVRIAIIDQPLLRNHIEYADKISHYQAKGLLVKFSSPKMHGPPVASIAVGKTCGVAPGAGLYYYALRMTSMPDNQVYCDIIDKIIQLNESATISEQIRVVSISTGMFPQQAHFDRWKETLANADKHRILVVTCDPALLKYGTLERIPGKDADDPSSYKPGIYSHKDAVLMVPAGNRTTASCEGPQVYTYWTNGGMSWAAPYLAGLAALAYQVDPKIEPEKIIQLWIETAVKTDAGPVVNPLGFIEAVKKSAKI